MEIEDRLEVKILQGRGLPPGTGGTCNPSVKVECATENQMTKTLSRTHDPEWDGSPLVFFRIAETGANHAVCTVQHKDMATGRNAVIGTVAIPLATALLSPGIECDEWFNIMKATDSELRPGTELGQIRVSITYFLQDFSNMDDDEGAGPGNQMPNCLHVTVSRAKGLLPPGKVEVCNAYLYVQVTDRGDKQRTGVAYGTNSPKWDRDFKFRVTDGSAFVRVKVGHRANAFSKQTIGVCRIPLVEIAANGPDGIRRWYKLLEESTEGGRKALEIHPESRGEVELALAWRYDRSYRKSSVSLPKAPPKKKLEPKHDAIEIDDDEDDLILTVAEKEALEADRADRLERAKKRAKELEELEDHDVVPGDYQVQVHIIEGSELKGESSTGMSNPFVSISCMGVKQKTSTKWEVSRCVWDEVRVFNFKNLSISELHTAEIKLNVIHKFGSYVPPTMQPLFNSTIGSYQFNLMSVYQTKYHEVWRQHLALTDPTSEKDNGTQGFLRVSVTVLGPGDKQKVHEPDEEESSSGELLLGPDVKPKLHFLVIYVFWAQDLPPMDFGLSGSGISAYFKCEFAGNPPLKTSKVWESGRSLSPEFHEVLWLPYYAPTMSNRIDLSLWDSNMFNKKLVAHTYFNLNDLHKSDTPPAEKGFFAFSRPQYDGPRPKWVNLYGAPLDVKGKPKGATQNTYPDEASTYRGRVLLGMHVLTRPPTTKSEYIERKDFDFDIPESLIPEVENYTLRASVLLGSECPMFTYPTGNAPMSVVIEFGPQRLTYSMKSNSRGKVTWLETAEAKNIELPKDISQLPDVSVFLLRGGLESQKGGTTVSYCRIPAAQLLSKSFAEAEPKWYPLKPDSSRIKTSADIGVTNYPGALLLKLGLGLTSDAKHMPWRDDKRVVEEKKPYCLRVHVYQGRKIPSKDENGLCDPYVKIRFAGEKRKTRIQRETLDPLYYQTLEFHEELPSDLRYAPEVVVQVWDYDSPPGHPSRVALLRHDLSKEKPQKSETAPIPQPKWMPLLDLNGEESNGALLLSFQLIQKRAANEKFTSKPEIQPPSKMAYLEIIALGVRDMAPFDSMLQHYRPITNPRVSFSLPAVDPTMNTYWETSKLPGPYGRGKNANFLQKQVLRVDIPENCKFSPNLTIRVSDKGSLAGACSISLAEKLPWNADDYVPPQSQLFSHHDDADEAPPPPPAGGGPAEVVKDGELEEKDESSPSARSTLDNGTGAFEADREEDLVLPMIKEDMLSEAHHQVNMEMDEDSSWWETPDLGVTMPGTDILPGLGEEEEIDLKALGIVFPTGWASAKFREGRDWWLKQDGKELEDWLTTEPFERYPVFRGKSHPNPEKSSVRRSGVFKGIIRVTESDPREGGQLVDMRAISKPKAFSVRLYVVAGRNLQPVGGGVSDPYLKIKLGNQLINDKDNYKKATGDPDFYRRFELETTIPGPTTLSIEVRDWQFNPFSKHELVGATTIDLEDRWFHKTWQSIGDHDARQLTPLEMRSLKTPDSDVSKGQLELWLEIVPMDKSDKVPMSDLFGPPVKKFELRLICWKSQKVPKRKGTDLFVRFRIPTHPKAQETDTHFRCKQGRASWNYRVKFPIELPMKNSFLGTLNVQLWDRDIVTSNNIIGEHNIDLYPWFLMAYHKDREIKPFQEIKEAKERLAEKGLADNTNELGEVELTPGEEETTAKRRVLGQEDYKDTRVKLLNASDPTNRSLREVVGQDHKHLLEEKDDAADDDEAGEEDPFLVDDDEEPQDDSEEEEDAAEAVNGLLDMFGMGKLKDDAQWLKMEYHNVVKRKMEYGGDIAVSVQIVPEDEVELRPVGTGRDGPEALPPPAGRLSLTLNPLSILSELIGPEVVRVILCCLCCVACLAAMGYLGTYYVTINTMINSF